MQESITKKSKIKNPKSSKEIKGLSKRFHLRVDEQLEKDITEAKQMTGITTTSQIIRSAIKSLIK